MLLGLKGQDHLPSLAEVPFAIWQKNQLIFFKILPSSFRSKLHVVCLVNAKFHLAVLAEVFSSAVYRRRVTSRMSEKLCCWWSFVRLLSRPSHSGCIALATSSELPFNEPHAANI